MSSEPVDGVSGLDIDDGTARCRICRRRGPVRGKNCAACSGRGSIQKRKIKPDADAGAFGRYIATGGELSVAADLVEVSVGLSDGAHHAEVEEALRSVLDAMGLRVKYSGPAVRGSWRRRLLARAKAEAPSPEQVAALLERGVELRAVDQSQAEVDLKQAEAVAKLISALDKEADAAIQIGSILLVKVGVVYSVRTLSPVQMRLLRRQPGLLHNPVTILNQLSVAVDLTEGAECTCVQSRPDTSCPVHRPSELIG